MSNIFHSTNLDIDFKNFEKELLKTNSFKYTITTEIRPFLAKYHHLSYVLALFEHKLESKYDEGNKFLFLNEILSDLLTNSSILFQGFYFASQILTRRLIENFYNHIYYFDHPVEFQILNFGKNEYVPLNNLKLYFDNHPKISIIVDQNIKQFNTNLIGHYQDLCKIVHTKGDDFMGLAKNLQEIKPEIDIKSLINKTCYTLQNIIYLLYKFHTDIEFTSFEQDTLARSFQKNLRKSLFS